MRYLGIDYSYEDVLKYDNAAKDAAALLGYSRMVREYFDPERCTDEVAYKFWRNHRSRFIDDGRSEDLYMLLRYVKEGETRYDRVLEEWRPEPGPKPRRRLALRWNRRHPGN